MRKYLAWIALLPAAGFAATTNGVRLQPAAPSPREEGSIVEGLSVGFSVSSLVPLRSPFEASIDGQKRAFRFQTSTSFGIEVAYGLTPEFEIALSTGFETLQTRSETGQGLTELATATLRQVPVEAVFRYRKPSERGWVPEAEIGTGLGLATVKLSSTNLSFKGVSESQSPLRAHLAVGAGFPWTEDLSLHFRAGYALEALKSKSYSTNIVDIGSRSMSGLYLNAQLRYAF